MRPGVGPGRGQPENVELLRQLIEWLSVRPRTYEETMSAWRTSCPRLPIWEDAVDMGLVHVDTQGGPAWTVSVTEAGRLFMAHPPDSAQLPSSSL